MSRTTNAANNVVNVPSLKSETVVVGVGSEGRLNGGSVGTLCVDLTSFVGVNLELRLYQYAAPGSPRSPLGQNTVYQIARGGELATLQFYELSGYAVQVTAMQESGNAIDLPVYWTIEAEV